MKHSEVKVGETYACQCGGRVKVRVLGETVKRGYKRDTKAFRVLNLKKVGGNRGDSEHVANFRARARSDRGGAPSGFERAEQRRFGQHHRQRPA